MKTQLKKLLAEIDALQQKNAGKPMDTADAASIDAKAAEAEGLQAQIDAEEKRTTRIKGLSAFAGRLVDPAMPPESQPAAPAMKVDRANETVGYLSAGDFVAASQGLQEFVKAGSPKGAFHLATLPRKLTKGRGGLFIPLTAAMMAEVKAVPTIGDNVIEPMRLADIVRSEEHKRLTLRDVLDVGTTTSNAVRYLRQTYTRGAAAVAQGAAKPESTISFESLQTAVRKIAVWMPVDDEQLADFVELGRIINEELLYDVDKHEEELLAYGSGVGEEFEGLFVDADIPTARVVSGDTLIDKARRMITDVRVAGYEPNAILADPMDWETIVLEKGSDNRYVWVVVTEGSTQRLWGVPVIETTAVRDFQGNETEERNLLVGDFRRGATLWDREQASIQIGWINDQFTKNKRTILAEKRSAFAVRRPLAFVKYTTQEAVVS